MVLALLARSPFTAALLLAFQPANDGIRYYSLKSPQTEHGLAWFVLNAFVLVGVALGATLLLGIAFGGFRLWLLNKFPNNRFNGTPDEPFSLSFPRDDPVKPEPGGET
jgi:hypothetical protein